MDFETLEGEGWIRLTAGGFTGETGPFWMREEEEGRTMGLLIEQRHTNTHMGTLHGGVVMTFADIALGAGIAKVIGDKAESMATLSLQSHFVAVARVGEFITCTPEVVRTTRDIAFVRGLIKVGDKTISNIEGIWKLLNSAAAK